MGCFGGAAERKEGTSEHLKCAAVIGLQVQDHLEGLDGCRRLAQLETSCTKEKPGGRQFATQLQTQVKTKAQAGMPAPEEKNGARDGACPGCGFRTGQNARRTPKRNCRSSNLALLISRKLPLVISPLGVLKCGELKRFEASTRSCTPKRSVMLTVRNRLKSRFTAPGPNRGLRPTLP